MRRFTRLLMIASGVIALVIAGFALMPSAARVQAQTEPVRSEAAPMRPEQGLAALRGYALPDGRPQAGLSVTLERKGYVVALATTTATGFYAFHDLEPGHYQLVALALNGEPFAVEQIALRPGEAASLRLGVDPPLALGPVLSQTPDACTPIPPPTGTASISGTVTSEAGETPLRYAYVTVYGPQNVTQSDSADAEGQYLIDDLPAGEYTVEFEPYYADNYLPEYYNNKPSADLADRLSLADGATLGNINAALATGGMITGTVTGDGQPLDDVGMNAYRIEGSRAIYAGYASTDSNGKYSFDALPTGTYQIKTYIDSGASLATRAFLAGQRDNVTVTAGATTANVNLALARGAQISGKVTAPDNSGVKDVSLYLYNAVTNSYIAYGGRTASDGSYTTQAVPSGSYKLEFVADGTTFQSEFYNNAPNLAGATVLNLATPTVTANINAQLAPGGAISGRVVGASNTPLAGVSVAVYAGSSSVGSATTDSTGTYTVTGLATGSYSVYFDPSYGNTTVRSYVGEYYDNQPTRSAATPVAVTEPNTTANINAELTPGFTISGCVSGNDSGRGIRSVQVEVRTTSGRFIDSTSSDSNGRYTTPGLPNGSYLVEFSTSRYTDSPGYAAEYYNNATYTNATPLAINGASLTGINAELARGGAFSGLVTNPENQPLDDISISIYDAQGYSVGYGSTDTEGRYVTDAVAPGSYRLSFNPFSNGVNAAYVEQDVGPAAVSVGTFTPVNAQLSVGGQISGTVTAPGGAGLDDISVAIYTANGDLVRYAFTRDATGQYLSTGLPAGSYRVGFVPYSDGVANQYAPEFYNNQPTLDSADPVAVTVGAVTPNINAELALGSVISGRITGPGGTGLAEAVIAIYDTSDIWMASASSGTDGSYTTSALASGTYRMCVFPPQGSALLNWCYNNKPDLASADPISVTAPTPTTGINLELARGSQVVGRVLGPDGAPLAGVQVQVQAQAAPAQTQSILAWATTATDGTFRTSPGLPAGSYTLQLTPLGNSTLARTSQRVTIAATGTDVSLADLQLRTAQRVYLPLTRR